MDDTEVIAVKGSFAEIGSCLQVGESAVANLHKQYYAAVERLYHKYQPSFPGYENVKLVVV